MVTSNQDTAMVTSNRATVTHKYTLALLALWVVLLAACSGDEDAPPAFNPTSDTPFASATPQPRQAGSATVASSNTPEASGMPIATATAQSGQTGTATEVPSNTPVADTPTPVPDSSRAEQLARDALASWLGPVGDPASITVQTVEAVTWDDACLGLGRVGQACAEVLVEGYRVELALGNTTYELRTDSAGDVLLWAPTVQILVQFAESSPNFFAFTTDDGGTIEAQPVPGTSFGVEVSSLEEGDPVGIALVNAPQREGLLLLWIDPME